MDAEKQIFKLFVVPNDIYTVMWTGKVFGIEERYKAKCLEKNDGLYWFEQAKEEFANVQADLGAGFTKDQWVQHLINSAKRKPYADGNFIEAKYLEACKSIGAL